MRRLNLKTLWPGPVLCFPVLYLVFILGLVGMAAAQTSRNATLDPSEENAVNSIFRRLQAPAPTNWNISGVLCSGVAIDDSQIDVLNPGLKCDCSFNANTTCHVTGLRIYALDVVGPLPDELWNLTYLTHLLVGQNYLTGPIPSSIGRLTRMQWLDFGINALSGQLPRELGLLRDLRLLAIGTNNFSGPFPSELGSLTRLSQLYFDSSGISGVIPSTFANLRSLQQVWGSDTRLTGAIPAFIGNWSQLTDL